jgi:hypothetical protein
MMTSEDSNTSTNGYDVFMKKLNSRKATKVGRKADSKTPPNGNTAARNMSSFNNLTKGM